MVRFIPVDPEEIDNTRQGRRGRVSYPILKTFMESGLPVAQLDRTGMQQKLQSLMSGLNYYINAHDYPVSMFIRRGELFFVRTDLDKDGNPISDDAEEVSGDMAVQKFELEKDQFTK